MIVPQIPNGAVAPVPPVPPVPPVDVGAAVGNALIVAVGVAVGPPGVAVAVAVAVPAAAVPVAVGVAVPAAWAATRWTGLAWATSDRVRTIVTRRIAVGNRFSDPKFT